jgi:DNA-binding IclR family transcriptional regulator
MEEDVCVLRSVANALRLVEELARSDEARGVTELARRLGVAPATAHRLLATLVAAGFARREEDRRYRLGAAAARLATRPGPPPLLRDVARPVLRWLAQSSGQTAHLAILDGTVVVSIDHVRLARGPADLGHAVGARVPAHATAVGLALLAHHPAAREAVLVAGLERWTARTIVDAGTLRRRLADVRRRGYAVNDRGWLPETAGVAAPVLLADGTAVASIGISGPADRIGRRANLGALGPLARAGALAVAEALAVERPPHPLDAR